MEQIVTRLHKSFTNNNRRPELLLSSKLCVVLYQTEVVRVTQPVIHSQLQ